jgi:hypothetical protein
MMMRLFQSVTVALVALSAPIGPCAAQDETALLDQLLGLFASDSFATAFPNGVVVARGRVVLPDGQTAPAMELICDRRSVTLRDLAAATTDLYPVHEGFCERIVAALARHNAAAPK